MFDRITFNSTIMGGRACIRGMRIPVSVIVGQIAHGATFDEISKGALTWSVRIFNSPLNMLHG